MNLSQIQLRLALTFLRTVIINFPLHRTNIFLFVDLPTQENVYVTSSLKDRQFNIDIHLVKVWPTPVCAIIFDVC